MHIYMHILSCACTCSYILSMHVQDMYIDNRYVHIWQQTRNTPWSLFGLYIMIYQRFICTHIQACMYVCMHVRMYVSIYVYICYSERRIWRSIYFIVCKNIKHHLDYALMRLCAYSVYMHINLYRHACIYKYILAHPHTQKPVSRTFYAKALSRNDTYLYIHTYHTYQHIIAKHPNPI